MSEVTIRGLWLQTGYHHHPISRCTQWITTHERKIRIIIVLQEDIIDSRWLDHMSSLDDIAILTTMPDSIDDITWLELRQKLKDRCIRIIFSTCITRMSKDQTITKTSWIGCGWILDNPLVQFCIKISLIDLCKRFILETIDQRNVDAKPWHDDSIVNGQGIEVHRIVIETFGHRRCHSLMPLDKIDVMLLDHIHINRNSWLVETLDMLCCLYFWQCLHLQRSLWLQTNPKKLCIGRYCIPDKNKNTNHDKNT